MRRLAPERSRWRSVAAERGFEEVEFPKSRIAIVDLVEEGKRKHHVPVLLELDVTRARAINQTIKDLTGESLSFTGWLMKCIAQAVSEHKLVHAMRKGKRLVVFNDVDVSVVVEGALEGEHGPARTVPMPYIVRRANEKSVRDIHDEIRSAQMGPHAEETLRLRARMSTTQRLFFSLPFFLRRMLLWRRLVKDPLFAKKTMGTVALTSVGMFGKGSNASGWGIPVGIHPLVVLLGGIARKPGVVGQEVQVRDYLSMTVLFDHDVVDGAPVARFLSRLRELIEGGYGLQTELTALGEPAKTARLATTSSTQ
jgi:pyruvate/2-oxoglutarate dehydrogenase complex dihydrolipoamide acyltransferase (E2) component